MGENDKFCPYCGKSFAVSNNDKPMQQNQYQQTPPPVVTNVNALERKVDMIYRMVLVVFFLQLVFILLLFL